VLPLLQKSNRCFIEVVKGGKIMGDQGFEIAAKICESEVKAGIRRWCPKCGQELKPGSYNYFEGFHVDGCE
jgi:hypothetical protein